jgi:hypothetical protein
LFFAHLVLSEAAHQTEGQSWGEKMQESTGLLYGATSQVKKDALSGRRDAGDTLVV